MMLCRLCGLSIEAIPEDAIQCGKLYRFTDGSYHFLRKQLAPRTGPRPRKSATNPDREAPPEPRPSTPPLMGSHAYEIPKTPEQPKEPERATVDEEPVGETQMEKAFRIGFAKLHVDWNYEAKCTVEDSEIMEKQ